MPKLTPPQLILLGALLGAFATYYAYSEWNKFINNITYRVQQNTMLGIKAQCDAGIPRGMKAKPPMWLGDFEPYVCYRAGR